MTGGKVGSGEKGICHEGVGSNIPLVSSIESFLLYRRRFVGLLLSNHDHFHHFSLCTFPFFSSHVFFLVSCQFSLSLLMAVPFHPFLFLSTAFCSCRLVVNHGRKDAQGRDNTLSTLFPGSICDMAVTIARHLCHQTGQYYFQALHLGVGGKIL